MIDDTLHPEESFIIVQRYYLLIEGLRADFDYFYLLWACILGTVGVAALDGVRESADALVDGLAVLLPVLARLVPAAVAKAREAAWSAYPDKRVRVLLLGALLLLLVTLYTEVIVGALFAAVARSHYSLALVTWVLFLSAELTSFVRIVKLVQ